MLKLACANKFFNEFHIIESVNIQPIFLEPVNWKLLHALINFKCILASYRNTVNSHQLQLHLSVIAEYVLRFATEGKNLHHITNDGNFIYMGSFWRQEKLLGNENGVDDSTVMSARRHPWWVAGGLLCLTSPIIPKTDNTDWSVTGTRRTDARRT